jgi:hypothetical protein
LFVDLDLSDGAQAELGLGHGHACFIGFANAFANNPDTCLFDGSAS